MEYSKRYIEKKQMELLKINQLLSEPEKYFHQRITLNGWVRTFRSNRFITLNDGSNLSGLQCVVDFESVGNSYLKQINTGASISVTGEVVPSLGKGQTIEMQVSEIEILGVANPEDVRQTILQPKRHSLEKLREQVHLRFRTNTFGAVFRIRHAISFAIHQYFNQKGFFYIHTPIITGSDAEGAGELFQVSTLFPENSPKNEDGKIDYENDFFGKKTHLTVSGQLEGETAALALGNIYTFGPTFRAENSNTSRHLSEFWMIEPEMAFYNLDGNMDLAEDFIKYILKYTKENCMEDLLFLESKQTKEDEQKPKEQRNVMPLIEKLDFVLGHKFVRLSYTEAIDILRESKPNKKKKFQYIIDKWGEELQSEHERYLVEKHFKSPVIVFNYPAKVKAFYMRLNEDEKTVRAMDVLFPSIGEIVGGSQREERYDVLLEKMRLLSIDEQELWWYLETRKFGSAPHSGFGLGLERLIMFVTGMNNIRDVIPYPRTPKSASF